MSAFKNKREYKEKKDLDTTATSHDALEDLISLVEKHPCIYRYDCQIVRPIQKRKRAWASISRQMGWDEATCRNKWRNLRDKYVNKKKSPSWRYCEQLKFLDRLKRRLSPYNSNGETSALEDFNVEDEPNFEQENRISQEQEEDTEEDIDEELSGTSLDLPSNDPPFESEFSAPRQPNDSLSLDETLSNVELEKRLKSYMTTLIKIAQTPPPKKKTKHDSFFDVAAGLLNQLPEETQDEAKMHMLNYIHELNKECQS